MAYFYAESNVKEIATTTEEFNGLGQRIALDLVVELTTTMPTKERKQTKWRHRSTNLKMEEYKAQLEQDIGKLIQTIKFGPLEDKIKHTDKLTELADEYKLLTGEYFRIE